MIIDYMYVHHLQCTGMRVEPVFSVETMACGYNEYQNAIDAPIGEILSCEKNQKWVIFLIPLC